MEDERSNIFHRLKLCTFGVELLGSGSGNMASDTLQANAVGRRFDNLNSYGYSWRNYMYDERSNIFHRLKLCTFGVGYWDPEVEIWRRI